MRSEFSRVAKAIQPRRSSLRGVIAGVALGFTAISDANGEETRSRLFSVTLPVIAILHDDLFVGDVIGYLDRTGTIDLRSTLAPITKCVGSFRYTGPKTGLADMRCDDGAQATLSFNALSAFSGYGYGDTPVGPASFTFGLDPQEATSHLTLPRGKRLIQGPEGLRLEPVPP